MQKILHLHYKKESSIILLSGRKPFADSLREIRLAVMPKLIMDEILSSSVELSTEKKVEPTPEVEQPEETKPQEEQPQKETLESLETLSEKTDDSVPLKKYMAEKNAKRDVEAKVKQLEAEITKLRENPYKSNQDIKVDVKSLSEKHGIDEEVLSDILNASYSMTKDKVKAELESELSPKLAEFEQIKREKEKQDFEAKFNNLVEASLNEMPEYANLIDKDDLKQWVKSGQYSKLTLPQLIEQKYGKFVVGKKTLENSYASKQVEKTDTSKPLSDDQYLKLDTDPQLRKEWSESLLERAKRML